MFKTFVLSPRYCGVINRRSAQKVAVAATIRREFSSTISSSPSSSSNAPMMNLWNRYEMGPPDPIIGLNEAYAKDTSPMKTNVGVGAYRDDNGLPYILPCVREAESRIHERMNAYDDFPLSSRLNHEYLGIAGDAEFIHCALKFAYGDVLLQQGMGLQNRIAAVQTLSGTGGLRVFGEFLLQQQQTTQPELYVPTPTWGNHKAIFQNAGFKQVNQYRYYDKQNSKLDFEHLIEDFHSMPAGSIVLLHACAHNPTGMDPTMEQWKEVSTLMKERQLIPFFDCAYQGFASGNADVDAGAIRMFVEDGHLLALVQSFSKNFGLYGQRVGALSIVCDSEHEADCVTSQLKRIIRPMYSNPPKYGANIVKTILKDEDLTKDFHSQCSDMAIRIQTMRHQLRSALEEGNSNNWQHITQQIGMFAYSGLSEEQVTKLRIDHSIYCTLDGRISMAGVTSNNVEYLSHAIHQVL